jgi:hypothetical protein
MEFGDAGVVRFDVSHAKSIRYNSRGTGEAREIHGDEINPTFGMIIAHSNIGYGG